MLDKLKILAKEIEAKLSASLANHNALLGYAAAINDAIKLASGVVDSVAPSSAIASELNVVEEVISAVEGEEQVSQTDNN